MTLPSYISANDSVALTVLQAVAPTSSGTPPPPLPPTSSSAAAASKRDSLDLGSSLLDNDGTMVQRNAKERRITAPIPANVRIKGLEYLMLCC
jgi:hypothetical protein